MNILTIDTATHVEFIGAASSGKVSDRTRISGVTHSATLFENIDSALKELGLTIKDIDLIGVGTGPGSFTGIRIAVSTARMLAQLLEIPLVDLNTHLLYAYSASREYSGDSDNILVAFDAKKNRVFGAVYRKNRNSVFPVETVAPGDYSIDLLVSSLDNNRTLMIGDGTEKYRETLEKVPDSLFLPGFLPKAEDGCLLTESRYKDSPDLFRDINRVVPCYARRVEAEIIKEINKKGRTF